MPIKSYTGLPGNGKTALMMEDLINEAKKGERPLFAGGIDGLQPGLATVLHDPRQWNAVKPGERCSCHDTEDSSACDAHVIPNGSLIYIDEAWKWFGHLHNATMQKTPEHVLGLAEHRHRGIDFVWTFQQPNQIYPFARGLMGEHIHVVRRFGTKMIDVFSWSELNEDVKSTAKRENAQRTTRLLPSHVFDAYKSAEIHTIKARVPWKVWAIPFLLVAFILLGWYAVNALRPENMAGELGIKGPNAAQAASAPAVPAAGEGERRKPLYANATEYARAHLPRQAAAPWSAPVYDQRGVTADPQLFCMSSREGEGGDGEWRDFSCTCLTEQGTAYYISDGECRTLARSGPAYNPYKERAQEQPPNMQPGVTGPVAPSQTVPGNVIAGEMTAVGTGGEAKGPGTAP